MSHDTRGEHLWQSFVMQCVAYSKWLLSSVSQFSLSRWVSWCLMPLCWVLQRQ